jgi:hypothetical protein
MHSRIERFNCDIVPHREVAMLVELKKGETSKTPWVSNIARQHEETISFVTHAVQYYTINVVAFIPLFASGLQFRQEPFFL